MDFSQGGDHFEWLVLHGYMNIINTVTGEHLNKNPFIELHDQLDGIMKYEISNFQFIKGST